MGFTDRKFEIMIGGLVLILVCGMSYLFKTASTKGGLFGDIVYEMPRPKNFQGSDLDLSDREISRNYINPFDKKDAKKALKDDGKVTQMGATKAALAAEAAKKAAAAAAAKKGQVTARIIERTASPGLSDKDLAPGSNHPVYGSGGYRGTAATGNGNGPDTTAQEDTKAMSPDQWKALILGEPTQANMNKLIEARNKGEVDSGTYNFIVGELMKNTNPTVQSLGLYGARTFPDAETFVLVVQNRSHLSGELQASAEELLQSYTQTSRISALQSVLSVSDEAVLAKATEIIIAGYQKAKSGVNTDPRTGRGDLTTESLKTYQSFIPLFQKLAASEDASIKALANSALAQIQVA